MWKPFAFGLLGGLCGGVLVVALWSFAPNLGLPRPGERALAVTATNPPPRTSIAAPRSAPPNSAIGPPSALPTATPTGFELSTILMRQIDEYERGPYPRYVPSDPFDGDYRPLILATLEGDWARTHPELVAYITYRLDNNASRGKYFVGFDPDALRRNVATYVARR